MRYVIELAPATRGVLWVNAEVQLARPPASGIRPNRSFYTCRTYRWVAVSPAPSQNSKVATGTIVLVPAVVMTRTAT